MGAFAFGLLAQPSAAVTTWSGSCTYRGWNQFWPGRTWVPHPSGYHWVAQGPCEGSLNGAPFDGQGTIDLYADIKQAVGGALGAATYGGLVRHLARVRDRGRAAGDEGRAAEAVRERRRAGSRLDGVVYDDH